MHDCFFFPFSGKIFCHYSLIHFFCLQPEMPSKVSLSHSMLRFHFEIGGIDTLLFSLAPLKVNIRKPTVYPLSVLMNPQETYLQTNHAYFDSQCVPSDQIKVQF
ncbi:hypothetical protein VIGAN_10224500 [Vigna angularis var. angularis]|uniref:Uncharacterized protein n=1 Tax=Vigna angularis var. angularis TaxID=157739 RepID=A0A0S3T5Y5_PHAAN|nr:hypothetical protein VIGAN_10224500 [Vigna angularis var. angularis]